jgi:hypothetical protein
MDCKTGPKVEPSTWSGFGPIGFELTFHALFG